MQREAAAEIAAAAAGDGPLLQQKDLELLQQLPITEELQQLLLQRQPLFELAAAQDVSGVVQQQHVGAAGSSSSSSSSKWGFWGIPRALSKGLRHVGSLLRLSRSSSAAAAAAAEDALAWAPRRGLLLGCTDTPTLSLRTEQSLPQHLLPPQLRALQQQPVLLAAAAGDFSLLLPVFKAWWQAWEQQQQQQQQQPCLCSMKRAAEEETPNSESTMPSSDDSPSSSSPSSSSSSSSSSSTNSSSSSAPVRLQPVADYRGLLLDLSCRAEGQQEAVSSTRLVSLPSSGGRLSLSLQQLAQLAVLSQCHISTSPVHNQQQQQQQQQQQGRKAQRKAAVLSLKALLGLVDAVVGEAQQQLQRMRCCSSSNSSSSTNSSNNSAGDVCRCTGPCCMRQLPSVYGQPHRQQQQQQQQQQFPLVPVPHLVAQLRCTDT